MTERIVLYVELLGFDKVEEILREYLQDNLGEIKKTPKASKEIKKDKRVGKRDYSKRVVWSPEEEVKQKARAIELFQEHQNWSKVAIQMSKETNRTVSSMYNHIYAFWKLNVEFPVRNIVRTEKELI